MDEVLRAVLHAAKQFVPLKKATVLLVDEQTQELVTRAGVGVTQVEGGWVGKVGQGVTGHVAQYGVPRYVPDVSKDKDYIIVESNVRAELALPLTHEGYTLGVLDVLSTRKKAFTKRHQRFLADIAIQGAAAVVAKRREERSDLLSRTSTIIANEPGKFATRLRKIVEMIPAGMRAGACSVFLEDPKRGKLVLEATTGLDSSYDGSIEYSLGEGVTGWVWENARPLRIVNLADEDELKRIDDNLVWRNKYSEALDTHAPRKQFLGVPLIASGRCIGVLRISRKLDGTNFTSDDEQLALTIAQQLADAIIVRRHRPSAIQRVASDPGLQAALPFSVRKSQKTSRAGAGVKEFKINRYCVLCAEVCKQKAKLYPRPSAFLAYPFHRDYPSVMENVKEGLKEKGYSAVLPVDPQEKVPDQGVLFCKLCNRTYGTDMLLADTTELNRNVLFEAGYALGLRKRVYFLVSSGRIRSSALTVPGDLESIYYESSQDILSRFPPSDTISIRELNPESTEFARAMRSLSRNIRLRSAYCLFPDDRYHQTDIKEVIYKTLTELHVEVIERERISHRFFSELKAISEAEFVVGDWVGDNSKDSDAKNSDTAFLLGLAMALGKKLIILQQRPVEKRMIDMHGVIAEYDGNHDIVRIVGEKLGSENLKRAIQPEEDVSSLVKRELTTYRIHERLMSRENFEFVYQHRDLVKPNEDERAFLELCANAYGYPKWGFQQVELF
ncbi:MAG: GAF domain-containing protein [Planctomycetota bacterium]